MHINDWSKLPEAVQAKYLRGQYTDSQVDQILAGMGQYSNEPVARSPRQPHGASGEWDPRQPQGATGEWGPVSQNVEDRRDPYAQDMGWGAEDKGLEARGLNRPQTLSQLGSWGAEAKGLESRGLSRPQASLPPAPPAPPPSAFRKEPSQNPIDNPSVPVPSGTGMIRNTRTGKEYRLGSESTHPSGQGLDYTRPVEVFGQGKGHYLKNDPMAAIVNGKRVDFGRDTGKELALAAGSLKMEEGRQKLREGEADIALKQQKLSAKPKAPPNYRWTEDGNLERIPGGPADEKVVNAFHADTTGLQSATSAIDNLLGVAKQVLESPGLESNYGIRGAVPNTPGSDAANTKALLQRLKDVAGFSALNDLKAAGKNGSSGLGAVTEFEHKILQNQLANVDKSQSAAQARAEIGNLIRATEASKQRLSNHYRSVYGKMIDDSVPDSPVPAPAETKPVIPGTPRAAGKTSFDSLPDPKEYEGKTIRDSHTGQRLKAVGGRWVPA